MEQTIWKVWTKNWTVLGSIANRGKTSSSISWEGKKEGSFLVKIMDTLMSPSLASSTLVCSVTFQGNCVMLYSTTVLIVHPAVLLSKPNYTMIKYMDRRILLTTLLFVLQVPFCMWTRSIILLLLLIELIIIIILIIYSHVFYYYRVLYLLLFYLLLACCISIYSINI